MVGLWRDPVEMGKRRLHALDLRDQSSIELEEPGQHKVVLLREGREEVVQVFPPIKEEPPGRIEAREQPLLVRSLALWYPILIHLAIDGDEGGFAGVTEKHLLIRFKHSLDNVRPGLASGDLDEMAPQPGPGCPSRE